MQKCVHCKPSLLPTCAVQLPGALPQANARQFLQCCSLTIDENSTGILYLASGRADGKCLHPLGLHWIRGQVPLAACVWILLITFLFYWARLDTGTLMILLTIAGKELQ